jgi:hypothetical protein
VRAEPHGCFIGLKLLGSSDSPLLLNHSTSRLPTSNENVIASCNYRPRRHMLFVCVCASA